MSGNPRHRQAAFTLIESLIAVALVAVLVTLAAPSFRDMILMQRLRGVNTQLVTDIQYARSEAISRGTYVHTRFQAAAGVSCYIVFTRPDTASMPSCDCLAAAGARCTDPALTEVRTVQVDRQQDSVLLEVRFGPEEFIIDPRTGGLPVTPAVPDGPTVPDVSFAVDTFIDDARRFRTRVGPSGRPSVCIPSGSTLSGDAC